MWIIDLVEFIISAGWRFWVSMMVFLILGLLIMTIVPDPAKFWVVGASIGMGALVGGVWTVKAKKNL